MIVDLSKLEIGQTVKFRCGGEAVVERTENHANVTWFTIWFEGYIGDDSRISRSRSGLVFGKARHPFDIIEITPNLFDWKYAKRGMAFRYLGKIVYYVAPHLNINLWSVFETPGDSRCYNGIAHSVLTRVPEYDKEAIK